MEPIEDRPTHSQPLTVEQLRAALGHRELPIADILGTYRRRTRAQAISGRPLAEVQEITGHCGGNAAALYLSTGKDRDGDGGDQ